ncbi:RNA polymerase sigma factor [Microcella alkaliphila]|uniref:RNA polymerase sigma factor n=1 Tax=Microcella alkaliphila TaxID=279828 RepID=A0A0U5B9U1_9MICO|nr:RNA polymerase sigma factor [Microcella alkaliphila]
MWNDAGWKDKPWSAPHLAPLFTELTADDTAPVWARRAVKFIHRYTREHGRAPTFREVFTELATQDRDAQAHQDAWMSPSVRYLTMVHWRRRGWIRFRREPRTLRSGPAAGELFMPKPPETRRSCSPSPGSGSGAGWGEKTRAR